MGEHTFLVAVVVNHEGTREEAELYLHGRLPAPGWNLEDEDAPAVDCWWIAEDDRRDRSDNDSAVFVPYHPAQRAGRHAKDYDAAAREHDSALGGRLVDYWAARHRRWAS